MSYDEYGPIYSEMSYGKEATSNFKNILKWYDFTNKESWIQYLENDTIDVFYKANDSKHKRYTMIILVNGNWYYANFISVNDITKENEESKITQVNIDFVRNHLANNAVDKYERLFGHYDGEFDIDQVYPISQNKSI